MSADAHRPRVLLVDDDQDLVRSLALGLRREPWDIQTAHSATEALQIVDKEPFDVIVTDDHMPRMRGSELLRILRTRHPDTMRLLLTGQASVESALHAINEAGVYRMLTKPCPASKIGDSVHSALEERHRLLEFNAWRTSVECRGEEEMLLCYERAIRTLHMSFQPVLWAEDLRVFGHEALLRTIANDTSGPLELFEMAGRMSRIPHLDAQVRGAVAEHMDGLPEGRRLLVNVHPATLADGALFRPDDPLHAFADRIILEITEQHDIAEIAAMADRIQRLREFGYQVAIDDLGAGYSGLNHFVLLRPDLVKFDRAMVHGVHRSVTRSKLLESMTSVCKDLGITTIAEGVELAEDHESILELGCDLVQGYYYGPPVSGFHGPWDSDSWSPEPMPLD